MLAAVGFVDCGTFWSRKALTFNFKPDRFAGMPKSVASFMNTSKWIGCKLHGKLKNRKRLQTSGDCVAEQDAAHFVSQDAQMERLVLEYGLLQLGIQILLGDVFPHSSRTVGIAVIARNLLSSGPLPLGRRCERNVEFAMSRRPWHRYIFVFWYRS